MLLHQSGAATMIVPYCPKSTSTRSIAGIVPYGLNLRAADGVVVRRRVESFLGLFHPYHVGFNLRAQVAQTCDASAEFDFALGLQIISAYRTPRR